jgi:transposase
MSDPSNPLRLEVVGVLRNGRRRYDPASKRRLVEACLQPGVSLAGVAMRHGVNANLLRKWVTGRPGKAARNADFPGPRLTVEMPNGVTLRLECSGQDVELVSAMIVTLGRCDVPAGR